MSFSIGKPKESMRFYPHFNRSMGKFVHTKKDYLEEMKRGGYVPSNTPVPNKIKPLERTKEGIELQKAIINQSKDGKFTPSGNLQKKLIEKKILIKRDSYEDLRKKSLSGGFEKS